MQTRRRPTCGTSRPLQPKDLVIMPTGFSASPSTHLARADHLGGMCQDRKQHCKRKRHKATDSRARRRIR
jgi:hypothetical protein